MLCMMAMTYVLTMSPIHNLLTLFATLLQEWREIQDALHPGQTAFDRAELCARVFKQKLDVLLQVLYACRLNYA